MMNVRYNDDGTVDMLERNHEKDFWTLMVETLNSIHQWDAEYYPQGPTRVQELLAVPTEYLTDDAFAAWGDEVFLTIGATAMTEKIDAFVQALVDFAEESEGGEDGIDDDEGGVGNVTAEHELAYKRAMSFIG